MADVTIPHETVQAGLDAFNREFAFGCTPEMAETIIKGAAPLIAVERDAEIARLRERRDEVLAILDCFDALPADDLHAETLLDRARNLLRARS